MKVELAKMLQKLVNGDLSCLAEYHKLKDNLAKTVEDAKVVVEDVKEIVEPTEADSEKPKKKQKKD